MTIQVLQVRVRCGGSRPERLRQHLGIHGAESMPFGRVSENSETRPRPEAERWGSTACRRSLVVAGEGWPRTARRGSFEAVDGTLRTDTPHEGGNRRPRHKGRRGRRRGSRRWCGRSRPGRRRRPGAGGRSHTPIRAARSNPSSASLCRAVSTERATTWTPPARLAVGAIRRVTAGRRHPCRRRRSKRNNFWRWPLAGFEDSDNRLGLLTVAR